MRLSAKIAVVTGSASGLGRGVARLFAKEGATTIVVDVNRTGGEETVELIRSDGGDVIFVLTDVVKSFEVRKMVEHVIERYGRVDILHNNAGGWKMHMHDTVTEDSEEEWDRLIELNLKSIYIVSREIIPHMIKNGGGSIINTVSINSFMPNPESAAYSAAKAGGYALMKAMAIDYAKHRIRVNGIAPGEILTPLQLATMNAFPNPLEGIEGIKQLIPLGRLGEPEDVAYVALWLASEEGRYLTGEIIVVDGGITVGRPPYPKIPG